MHSSVSIILSSNNSSGIGNILLTDALLFRFVLACSVSPRVDYKELVNAVIRATHSIESGPCWQE